MIRQPLRQQVLRHALLSAALCATFAAPSPGAELSAADRQAIAAQIGVYRTAWLEGDAARVKSLFLADAVFLPHHGLEPVVGLEALSAFWWPPGGTPFRILRFDLETTRIEGAGDLAYAWGRQVLEWSQADAQGERRLRTRGNHLTVFRRTPAGWRIELQMSDDEPTERF